MLYVRRISIQLERQAHSPSFIARITLSKVIVGRVTAGSLAGGEVPLVDGVGSLAGGEVPLVEGEILPWSAPWRGSSSCSG